MFKSYRSIVAVAVAVAAPASANWRATEIKDPITDKVETRLFLDDGQSGFVFACSRQQRPMLTYMPKAFMGGPIRGYEWRDFTYRLDDRAPTITKWKYTDDVVVAPTAADAVAFVKATQGVSTILVRATAYNGSAADQTFIVGDPNNVAANALAQCGID